MKRRFSSRRVHHLAKICVFLIMAALIAGMAGCELHPQNLEIRTWYDLDAVRDGLAGNYTLINDLDSTTLGYEELASPTANGEKGWEPIIEISQMGEPRSFSGTFDGQGYKIRDLYINRPDEDHVGLFSFSDGIIKNIGMVNATVIGGNTVGGLVGTNYRDVRNSYSTGSVTGNERVGGLAGETREGDVYSSYSSCNVTGEDGVGGLVGYTQSGIVFNCYCTGTVTGNSDVGGLVGWNEEGTVNNSFWDIETSGQTTSDGGIGINTTQMKDIATFSGAGWSIIAVALNETNPAYIWNIVNEVTYPFLSWQPI